jgi:hypothetical protein
MTETAGFTVADLRSRAGEEAFRAAGEHVVAIDGPDEDEWSLSATVRRASPADHAPAGATIPSGTAP